MGSIRSKDLSRVLNLIDEFGIDDVKKGIIEASKCEKYSVNFVSQILYENMNRKVEMEISNFRSQKYLLSFVPGPP
jgi:hypothetical protein